MKMLLSFFLFLFCIAAYAQNVNPNYDSTLAKKLDADDLGMKNYVLVILKTGTNQNMEKAFRDSCFRGHFANINKLVENGKLLVAGPLGKNENEYRGIFIFNVTSIKDAEQLLQNDPTVTENIFKAEYYEWYGSAALPEYLPVNDKIWKVKP